MDIYDIIIVAPHTNIDFILDANTISFFIFGVTLFITALILINYRRFIAICTLNYITTLLQNNFITYKHFSFLLARILCYRHKANKLLKDEIPVNSSKDKHYLWIALVDGLNEARYQKQTLTNQSQTKLHKIALEWLRHS